MGGCVARWFTGLASAVLVYVCSMLGQHVSLWAGGAKHCFIKMTGVGIGIVNAKLSNINTKM